MQTARPTTLPRASIVWLIAVCALVAFVALAVAEEGIDATELTVAPDAPLPFARHRVVGLDLSTYSSLEALTWLQASGITVERTWPLVVLPADEDVVAALAADDDAASAAALQALDSLVGATQQAPVAMCLRRPPDTDAEPLAEAIFDALATRYAGQVVYAFACDADDSAWQRILSDAAPGTVVESGARRLLPVAGAAVVALTTADEPEPGATLEASDLTVHAASYEAYQMAFTATPAADVTATFAGAVSESAHAALLLAQPARELNPTEFTSALINIQLSDPVIPQGFSSVMAPGFAVAGTWRTEWVATTPYAVASGATAELTTTALGTDFSLITVFGPNAGSINVWIDPPPGTSLPLPDATYDLTADQAQPVSLLIAQGLAAREHRIVVQAVPAADGGEVRIAGLFVSGASAPQWTGFLAASVLLVVVVAALTERAWSAIRRIRALQPTGRRAGPLGRSRYLRDR